MIVPGRVHDRAWAGGPIGLLAAGGLACHLPAPPAARLNTAPRSGRAAGPQLDSTRCHRRYIRRGGGRTIGDI